MCFPTIGAFYGGPVWAAHRGTANPTMLDSDNVLLLRPAWAGAALRTAGGRAAADAVALPRGLLHAFVLPLHEPGGPALQAFCRGPLSEALRAAGAQPLGWYATEPAPNNFPRLPVREGEQVLVGLAMFDDAAGHAAFAASVWPRDIAPALAPWLAGAVQALRLAPTARSALHG